MENTPIKVDSSKSLAQNVKKTLDIVGMEDVPMSMIPIPFYKLVQPTSTNVGVGYNQDANPGTFYMADLGTAVSELKFAFLRAKRLTRDITDNFGNKKKDVVMGILGLNLERMTPFILSISPTSFNSFGRLAGNMNELRKKGLLELAWEFPVIATTEKKEKKLANGTMTKYYVVNFTLSEERLSAYDLETARAAYEEFATSLDRNTDDEVVAGGSVPQNDMDTILNGHEDDTSSTPF